jgi:hypothetical protein
MRVRPLLRAARLAHLATIAIMAAACGSPPGAGAPPDPDAGCCRDLVTLYEASIFKVNVMRVRVRVDDPTASAVGALVRGAPRSPALDSAITRRYQAARDATVDVEFLLAMSGETFIANAVKSLRGLVGDGQLAEAAAAQLSAEARTRFGFLTAAGVRPADQIRYAIAGDTVTTRYLRGEQVLMDDRQVGALHRDALLASYFAPSSDFRRGLVEQVFKP